LCRPVKPFTTETLRLVTPISFAVYWRRGNFNFELIVVNANQLIFATFGLRVTVQQ
jgi:hypothetical protein